jgi:actin-related protein
LRFRSVRLIKEDLGIDKFRSENHVLLAVPSLWNRNERERIAQIFFEIIDVPGISFVEQPLLTVFGMGLVTGLVIDIGHETINVSAVFESSIYTWSQQTIHVGGKHIAASIEKTLVESATDLKGVPLYSVVDAILKHEMFRVHNPAVAIDLLDESTPEILIVQNQEVFTVNYYLKMSL